MVPDRFGHAPSGRIGQRSDDASAVPADCGPTPDPGGATERRGDMSAQTTASRQAGSLHSGALGAVLVGIVAIIAAIAFAVALLGSPARPAAPDAARPAFNAPAFRAEEHHLLLKPASNATSSWSAGVPPAYGGNGLGTQQQSRSTGLPRSFGGNALRADRMGGTSVPTVKSDFSNHNR